MCGSRTVLPPMSKYMLALPSPRSSHSTTSAERISFRKFVLSQRFAGRNHLDDAIHMNVAGKIEIEATAADFGPRLHLLFRRVQKRITLHHGHFAVLDPLAVKVPLDTAPAPDVRRTELRWLGR